MKTSPYFDVCGYKVTSERLHHKESLIQAVVEVRIGHECVRRSATGVGPVHALDNALRACLAKEFPELDDQRLSDYRVTVVDGTDATAAQVKVLITSTDGRDTWDAGCISENIIEASFEALCSSTIMGIMRARSARQTVLS
ncbi:MAG TPA: alpha-isopropylmalate synthase regulatory domain-containing protein [Actinomycetota bacterium]|nr:alpha-isopropylmalate synthase regulatory domain-containing protein [Actinomycetota bacterium]